MSDKGTVEQLYAEPIQAQALTQARRELEDLQGANREFGRQLADVTENRDYWYVKAVDAEAERDKARKEAQEQSDDVQRDWLSPCQKAGLETLVETLRQQIALTGNDEELRKNLVAKTQEAASWQGVAQGAESLIETLRRKLRHTEDRYDYWLKEHDEVQRDWLSPVEAEGLQRQLAGAEAQIAATKEAVEWIWGFWDDNTLVARSSGYEEKISTAWNKLLAASNAFSKSWERHGGTAEKILERLATLDAVEAALDDGRPHIHETLTKAELIAHVKELGRTIDAERTLRQEAEATLVDVRQLRQEAARVCEAMSEMARERGKRLEEAEKKRDWWRGEMQESDRRHTRTRVKLAGANALLKAIEQRATSAEARLRGRGQVQAQLVTPELANILVLLACATHASQCPGTIEDAKAARKLAAQIREALDDSQA